MNPNMVFEKLSPNPFACWSQMRKYLCMACPGFNVEVNDQVLLGVFPFAKHLAEHWVRVL